MLLSIVRLISSVTFIYKALSSSKSIATLRNRISTYGRVTLLNLSIILFGELYTLDRRAILYTVNIYR